MANTVTFSVTATPKNGAQDIFRDAVLTLQAARLRDCILSVFHINDTYALLSGEALPAEHTRTNAALRTYLVGRLLRDDTGLDLDVKIDAPPRVSPPRS